MSKQPSSSPGRHTFQLDARRARREEEGETVDDDFVAFMESIREQERNKWSNPERCRNNMEYDLVTTDWILEKVRADRAYAQNLYAAMCNNEFQKNDVWPRLADQRWGCSWRSAGGVIADMRQEGDYIDWYCSGIRDIGIYPPAEENEQLTDEQKAWVDVVQKYVSEGTVTDEIREDLFRLGWLVIDEDSEEQ
jgi:hypothetical protein